MSFKITMENYLKEIYIDLADRLDSDKKRNIKNAFFDYSK